MFPHFSDDDRLLLIALVVALLFGLFWWWNRAAKKWLEETGREQQWPSTLDWLLRDVQQKPATPLKYSEQEFQEMVAKALDEVPEEFDKEWDNVAVTVSTKGFSASSGSRHVIMIYQPALELCYGSDKERLQQEIRRVVLHELAHHLGMSHPRMKEIGL